MADEFILTETGFNIILEDGSGDLLLEVVVIIPDGAGSGRKAGGAYLNRKGIGRISARAGAGSFTSRKGRGRF